jgi:hypothetical protein
MSDSTLAVTATGSCSTKGNLPTLDRQQTSAGVSTAAALVKQRPPYLAKAPLFQSGIHTFYRPIAGLVVPWDCWIDSVSWSAPGGLDEIAEIQNAAGQTLFRGVAQALDDSRFASVKIGRFAKGGYTVTTLDSGRLDVFVGRPLRNA